MKLEISNRKNTRKFTNMWKLNNIFLSNQWVKEEITREIIKYLETNANENTTYQNLQGATTAVLRGKFITLNVYILKISNQKSQINNLTLHLK